MGELFHTYTFRWEGQTPQWETWLKQIFNRQSQKFKLNYSHSSILWNTDFEEYRPWHASKNNARVWELPRLIENWGDMQKAILDIENSDVYEIAYQLTNSDTKSSLICITSTTFYVDSIPGHTIG